MLGIIEVEVLSCSSIGNIFTVLLNLYQKNYSLWDFCNALKNNLIFVDHLFWILFVWLWTYDQISPIQVDWLVCICEESKSQTLACIHYM